MFYNLLKENNVAGGDSCRFKSLSLPSSISSLLPEESISQVDVQLDEDDIYEDPLLFDSVSSLDISNQKKPIQGQEQYIRVDEANVKETNTYLKVIWN